MTTIESMCARRKERHDEMKAMLIRAEHQRRDLTPVEATEFWKLDAEVDGLGRAIPLRQRLEIARARG